jgi:hypothetical protein
VFGSNRGGVGFSGLQHYSDPHKKANTVWGFGNKLTAEKKVRQNDPEKSLWTTFVGAPNQHKSNTVVLQDAMKEFQNAVKAGKVHPAQIKLMNERLRAAKDEKTGSVLFDEAYDLTDPQALEAANTFARRSTVGDVLLGEGVKGKMRGKAFKEEHGSPAWSDAGRMEDILKRETDPDLVDAGTYDVGNRLFVMDNGIIHRPDLNVAFPYQVTGNDLGFKFQLTPKEQAMRNWMKQYEGRLNKSGKPAPVSYMDLARNQPSQFVDEDYLTFLQKQGNKDGGAIDIKEADKRLAAAIEKRMAKGGAVDIEAADARLQAAIDARLGMADGGGAFKKLEFMADGGKLVKGAKKVMDVLTKLPTGTEDAQKAVAAEMAAKKAAQKAAYAPHTLPTEKGNKTIANAKRALGKEYDAPQAEALRLAQERAALPPAKGGLGLPANNTPAQRAKAMGFDRDTYHGSFKDVKKLDPRVGSTESHAGKGVYSTDSAEDASRNYASIYGPDVTGRVERGVDLENKSMRKTHNRMRDESLSPLQQSIILRNTIDADNIGVVYPLKVRSDKSIHLDKPESNPHMVGPFERYDEAADMYVDTPHTPKFNEALDEFSELGGETNPIREFMLDYADEEGKVPARDLFNAIKKEGNETGHLYDPYLGDIVSGGVAAGDFMKHFGVDEIRHTPQFMNPQLNIGGEHTISMNPDNVRSRFAAFDPFRKNAAIAAAMGVAAPDLLAKEKKPKEKKKAEGGGAFKTLQFKDTQHFDGGGIAVDLSEPSEDARREPALTEKDWANIKRNAPKLYKLAKEQVAQEASQLTTAGGAKDFALRTGAQFLGGIPDLINLGLMGVDAGLSSTRYPVNLSSEKPWLGSERYLDALRESGAIGENEFPLAEITAGILAPAGLIKKGAKKLSKLTGMAKEPKKRLGGLTALSR